MIALLARIPAQIPRILVANKADLPAGAIPQPVDVPLSALEGTGEAALVQALLERCGAAGTDGMLVALHHRQRDLAARAAEALARPFVAQPRAAERSAPSEVSEQQALRDELAALRAEVQALPTVSIRAIRTRGVGT